MNPIETLMHEHQIILMVLSAAEREAALIRSAGEVNSGRIEMMLDFFRNFADKCHHAKEENLLFERMTERGMPREGGPIAVMLHEHDLGRGYIQGVSQSIASFESGDESAKQQIAGNLHSYVDLLRAHMQKEDGILYPMAQQILSSEDMNALADEFDRVECEEMGEGTHEKYHRIAHELGR